MKRNQKSEQKNKNYCVIAALSNSDVNKKKIVDRSQRRKWIYLKNKDKTLVRIVGNLNL